MKALFTFILIAFLTPLTVFAQKSDSLVVKRFHSVGSFGVQGGLNISWLSNLNNYENRLGVQAGFFGERRFSRGFGIAAEVAYSQQGVITDNIELGLNYLKVPLLLNIHETNVTIQGGVYGGFLLKAKARAGKVSEEITRHFHDTDAGICLGLTINSFGGTFIGARFYQGMQNVNKSATTPLVEIRNSSVQVTAGYSFR